MEARETMTIDVMFPGGRRVDVRVGDFVVRTDQPRSSGGDESAPAPFDLFLASLASCAGIYVLGFCQARGLSTDGLALRQRVESDPDTHLPSVVSIAIQLPPTFPAKYRTAVVRAAENCKVKKTLAAPPMFEVVVTDGPNDEGTM
jgi:ribosomal protein S12 methylthiotransferase accessory factor